MAPNISFEYSLLWLVPILLGALAAAWFFYFSPKSFSKNVRYALAALRFLVFFLLGLLLLSPLLEYNQIEKEKPLLIWLEDHSSSMMATSDSSEVKDAIENKIPDILRNAEENYRVVRYSFGSELEIWDSSSFKKEQTDIYNAINEARNRHHNENIGAMVLMTDGIYNLGLNPAYTTDAINYPVYTLGSGDTTIVKDIFIDRLNHNRISYLENEFPVEIAVRARMYKGRTFNIRIFNSSGQAVFRKELQSTDDNHFQIVQAYLSSGKAGLQRFTVQLDVLEGEYNSENNRRSFNIEVIDNRKKILIKGSSPHPDMSALGRALSKLEKYEVVNVISEDTPENFNPDLYILHYPDEEMLRETAASKKPYWVIAGYGAGEYYSELASVKMPQNRDSEEVMAAVNKGFNLFGLEQDIENFTERLPPLSMPFGKIESSGDLQVLFYKKIGSLSSREPLWFFTEIDDIRSAHTLGSGLWKWRLYNYRQEADFVNFDALVAGTVQYLTARAEDSRFVVEAKNPYSSREDIRVNARLFNKSLELTNQPEVEMSIISEEGMEYSFEFSKSGKTYHLNAGKLPPGNYTYKASTALGEEKFVRNGAFSVQKPQIESIDLVARHELMKSISEATDGSFYLLSQSDQLEESLRINKKAQSIQVQKKSINSLLSEKWIFFILLLLLATEWGMRKYFGKY